MRVEKKFLVPTETGELIVDSLVGRFEFLELGFTRDVEQTLDRVAAGEATYRGVVQRVYEKLQGELSTLQVSATPKHPCPECGKSLRRIKGGSGFFWGCSGHPTCSVTLPDERGKPGKKKPLEVSSFACAKCGLPLIHRVKKGKGGYDFFGCKETYPNKDGKPDFNKAK